MLRQHRVSAEDRLLQWCLLRPGPDLRGWAVFGNQSRRLAIRQRRLDSAGADCA
jgi:hypothetical protein